MVEGVKNLRQSKTIRPRSFAASPHAVILEQGEESRGATPLEDDTGGGGKVKSEENVGEDIILPPKIMANR